MQYMDEFRALFESNTVLILSEDVTSLSTQMTLDDVTDDADGAAREEDEGEGEGEGEDENQKGEKAETTADNLLVADDNHFSS
jgi:hypothetical protein